MSKPQPSIHVLLISTWYPVINKMSGIFIVEQARALAKHDLKLGYIFARLEGLRSITRGNFRLGFPRITRTNSPVFTIGISSWAIPAPQKWRHWLATFALRRLFDRYIRERGKPDILHGHVGAQTGDALRSIANAYAIPFIITEHSSVTLIDAGKLSHGAYLKTIYNGAHVVVPVSETLAGVIRNAQVANTLIMIPNMVSDKAFAKLPQRTFSDKLRIIIIGSLVPSKRVDVALKAIAVMRPDLRSQLEVVIVGGGPEAMTLQEQGAAMDIRVEFLGTLDHDASLAQIASADMLLHASAVETFGIVLIEAMAMGLPVIASRSGGPEGFVTPQNGYLVDIGDDAGMTLAIEDVVENIDQWRMRGPEISNYVRNLYHEDAIIPSIIEVYKNVIDNA